MSSLPILYVLVGAHGGPQFSPTVFKSLLCLYHKRVQFEIRELVWTELRAKKEAWKTDRPTLPTLELPSGDIIGDSDKIAEWLESEYPETASLFVPTQTSSQVDKTALNLAKNYHSYLSSTFGSPSLSGSASPFSAFFAAVAEEGILGLIKEEKDRDYFKSDTKLRTENGWNKLKKLNRDDSIRQSKNFVVPLESVLKSSSDSFFAGEQPGIIDYTIYGRYAFQRVADPSTAKQIWRSNDTPNVSKWIESIEERYAEEMKDQKSKWPQ